SAIASSDMATTSDALSDVIQGYSRAGKEFEYACCIYPTAPFVTRERLVAAFEMLQSQKADVVFPVMPFSYPIFRSLKMENGRISMFWDQYRDTRSQDLPAAYHDAGQFYF